MLDLGDVSRMLGNADDAALADVVRVARQHAPDLVEDLRAMAELGRLEHES